MDLLCFGVPIGVEGAAMASDESVMKFAILSSFVTASFSLCFRLDLGSPSCRELAGERSPWGRSMETALIEGDSFLDDAGRTGSSASADDC